MAVFSKNKIFIIAASFVSVLPFSLSLFPYNIPLFLPLALIFFLSVTIYYRDLFFSTWTLILSTLVVTYILPIIITGNIYNPNFKDFRNIITYFILFSALYTLLNEKSRFINFTVYFQSFCLIFTTIISLIGLTKLLLLINGIKIDLFYTAGGTYPWGTSLISDYNVFGIGIIFGLISAFFLYRRATALWHKYMLLICCPILSTVAALAGSRRTWLLIFIIGAFLFANLTVKYLTAIQFKINKYHIANSAILIILFMAFAFNHESISSYLQNKQPVILTKTWNRFKTLENISHGEGGVQTRTKRFKYAIQIIDDYTLAQLIFGNGSQYHIQFGQRFSLSNFDKPHNILLSTMLHSGIVGLVIIVLTILYSIFLYFKHFYFDEVKYFFYLFIVLVFITFSSSDTIFSNKRFLFCLLLPYIIDAIYRSYPLKN